MAPRKEKGEKTTVNQGAAMVPAYLRKQNRPYSVQTDVSANLHNKVSKSISITEALLDVTDKGAVHAARFLKEMHDQKEIEGKTSSERSQQSPLIASADDPSSRQASRPFITTSKTQPKTPRSAILHSSTVPIADLRTKLAERKSTERSLKANLSLISSVTSTSDLRSTVDALKTQKEGLLERLTQLKRVEGFRSREISN